MENPFEEINNRLINIENLLKSMKNQEMPDPAPTSSNNPLDDYIPKCEIRDKYASSSTLWNWEKSGKLKSYAVGGKRYYKRVDIENLFTEIK